MGGNCNFSTANVLFNTVFSFQIQEVSLQRVRAGISAVGNNHPPLGTFCTANPKHGQRRGKKERTVNENHKNKNNFINRHAVAPVLKSKKIEVYFKYFLLTGFVLVTSWILNIT